MPLFMLKGEQYASDPNQDIENEYKNYNSNNIDSRVEKPKKTLIRSTSYTRG